MKRRARIGLAVAASVAGVVLPATLSGTHVLQFAAAGAYAIAILGLDLLVGQGGLVSLGQGALMALGGYTTAILMVDHGIRDLWTIPAAGVVAGAAGLVAGVAFLRRPGFPLAIATFTAAVATPTIVRHFAYTGRAAGIDLTGVPAQTGHGTGVTLLDRHVSNAVWVYVVTAAAGILLFSAVRALGRSRLGRSLRAASDNELAAVAVGIRTLGYRAVALGAAGFCAGVAGSLLALGSGGVDPGLYPATLSVLLVAGAVLGGYASIWGALGGALAIEYTGSLVGALPHVGAGRTGPATFVLGALLVAAVLARRAVAALGARR